jgi:hypothetical protein
MVGRRLTTVTALTYALEVALSDWPPGDDEYFPLRIMERLRALKELTQVRSAGWTNGIANVRVWPYSDSIVEVVRERLAPLETVVEPQEWLPRRYSRPPDRWRWRAEPALLMVEPVAGGSETMTP